MRTTDQPSEILKNEKNDDVRNFLNHMPGIHISEDQNPWLALCVNELLDIFLHLIALHIIPTSADLSCSEDAASLPATHNDHAGMHAWWRLARRKDKSISLFKMLLEKNVIPSADVLSQPATRGNDAGKNTWWWLARNDMSIFKILPAKGVIPNADALSEPATRGNDAGKNTWWWLARNDKAFFRTLVVNGVIPNADALSQPATQGDDAGKNTWWWLAIFDLSTFKILLAKGVIPSADALSQPATRGYGAGKNTWWLLARDLATEGGLDVHVFPILLKKNVIPNTEALSEPATQGDDAMTNVWHWLVRDRNTLAIFKILLEKDVIPSANALSIYSSRCGDNAWHRLSYTNEGIAIFNRLINENVIYTGAIEYFSRHKEIDQGAIARCNVYYHHESFFRKINAARPEFQATLSTSPRILPVLYLMMMSGAYLSWNHFMSYDACDLTLEFLLTKHQQHLVKSALLTEERSFDAAKSFEFLRLLLLKALHDYQNTSFFLFTPAHANRADSLFEAIKETTEPQTIFDLLSNQLCILQNHTRRNKNQSEYKHPYLAPQKPHEYQIKNRANDGFEKIIYCGFRLFPRQLVKTGQSAEYLLPFCAQ